MCVIYEVWKSREPGQSRTRGSVYFASPRLQLLFRLHASFTALLTCLSSTTEPSSAVSSHLFCFFFLSVLLLSSVCRLEAIVASHSVPGEKNRVNTQFTMCFGNIHTNMGWCKTIRLSRRNDVVKIRLLMPRVQTVRQHWKSDKKILWHCSWKG